MNSQTRKRLPAAAWILIGMVLGIVIGYMIFISFPDKKTAAQIAGYVSIMSDVFLRLIKMLIGPLVFATLVVGIAHMGDAKSVGRVFFKAIGWFVTASLISLVLGLIMANLLEPGKNLGLPLPDIGASANLATSKFTLKDFISHLVPKSFAEAMANNEILQIVVFSMFFGVALAALGEKERRRATDDAAADDDGRGRRYSATSSKRSFPSCSRMRPKRGTSCVKPTIHRSEIARGRITFFAASVSSGNRSIAEIHGSRRWCRSGMKSEEKNSVSPASLTRTVCVPRV